MDSAIVKRNYIYFILKLLKERTSKEGEHLSSEQIIKIINEEYGLEPNRKTIYTAMDDLIAMGFDIQLEKKGANPGYYLGERALSETEIGLLIDGIESLDNITSDDKTDIYDRLCQIVGYPSEKVDNYLYNKKHFANEWIDDPEEDDDFLFAGLPETKEKLDRIFKAIKENKQLIIETMLLGIQNNFIVELPEDKKASWNNSLLRDFCPIHPFQLFRNKNNEICLLFCVEFEGDVYPGFINVTSIDNIEVSKKKRKSIDPSLFPEDLSDYETAREYREGQILCEAELFPGPGVSINSMYFEFIRDDCVDCIPINVNGNFGWKITYKLAKQKSIEDLIIDCLPNIKVLPGSSIYDHFMQIQKGLNALYNKD